MSVISSLLSFPFSDLQARKPRPGLVLMSDDADVLLVRVTTQAPRGPLDVALVHWSAIGLLGASTVRLTKLATIDRRLVYRRIGRLDPEDGRAMAEALKRLTAAVTAELQT